MDQSGQVRRVGDRPCIKRGANNDNGCDGGRWRPYRRYDCGRAKSHLRFLARHCLRMVRLLHLRNAGRVPRQILLLQRAAECRLHFRAACLRRGLRRPPVRRADLRPSRRHDRTQIHLPDHDDPDGHRHLLHRSVAGLCDLGHRRAGRADRLAPGSGPCARRRIWRRGDLRRRACAEEQARLLHLLDPDHGNARPVPGAAADPRHPHLDGRGIVRRLGLAHSVPAVRHPSGRLDLDPA